MLAFVTLHGLEGQLWWLGVPRRAPPWDERLTPTPAPSGRLQWLTEPAIAAHYRGPPSADGQESADSESPPAPAGLTVYGWPESRPEHIGVYIAQRFERAVLIVWVMPPADGPPTGTVEVLPLGPLVARTSVFQGLATTPDTLVGGRLVARAPRSALDWPVLPTPTPTAVPPTATATAAPEPVAVAPGGCAAGRHGSSTRGGRSTWSSPTRAARRRTCKGGCWRARQVDDNGTPSQM